MAASMLLFLEVCVLLSLLALLFSCTRMVRRSPMAAARLSESIEREDSVFQSDWACTEMMQPRRKVRLKRFLKQDHHRLFILNLSFEFATRLSVAQPDDLTGNSVLERFGPDGNR